VDRRRLAARPPNGPLGVVDRWVLIVGWARIADAVLSRVGSAALRLWARRTVRKLRFLRDAARHDPNAVAEITKTINAIDAAFKQQ
jgi:hypothetical protein